MLQSLCEHGFVPELVIDESSPAAHKGAAEQAAVLSQHKTGSTPPNRHTIATEYGFQNIIVSDHNSEETVVALRTNSPDLIILGDTRILKQQIIDIPQIGIINLHPGWLPDVRGNNPYIWAIENNLPQGVSAHFVDAGVDTGPIIERRSLSISSISNYPELIWRLNQECADLIVETMRNLQNGKISLTPQPLGSPAYREAGEDVKACAIEHLVKARIRRE